MTKQEIYEEIKKCEQSGYFDITYKGKHDWELIKDTIKLVEISEETIKVGFAHSVYSIPLEKVAFISEPNDICLRYRLRDEYYQTCDRLNHFARNDNDMTSDYIKTDLKRTQLFNHITKLLGSREKALAFIGA